MISVISISDRHMHSDRDSDSDSDNMAVPGYAVNACTARNVAHCMWFADTKTELKLKNVFKLTRIKK